MTKQLNKNISLVQMKKTETSFQSGYNIIKDLRKDPFPTFFVEKLGESLTTFMMKEIKLKDQLEALKVYEDFVKSQKYSHPFIVQVQKVFKEFNEEEGGEYKLCIVTSTVQDSLEFHLSERKNDKFSNKELADFTYQLASALNYLHTRDYIMGYGQIDTKNIYIYLENLSLDIQFSNKSKFTVESLFLPPEYNARYANSMEGDIYSLGLVFFQMVTLIDRKLLCENLKKQDYEEQIQQILKQNELSKLIKKMISQSPKDRPNILKVLNKIKDIRKSLGFKDITDNDFNPYEEEEVIFEEQKIDKIFDILEKESHDTYTTMLAQLKDGQSLQTYKIIEGKFKSVDEGDNIYVELFKLSRIKQKNIIKLAKFFKFGTIDTTIQAAIPYISKSLTSVLEAQRSLNTDLSKRLYYFQIDDLANMMIEIAEGMRALHESKYYFPQGHFSTDNIYIKNDKQMFIDIWTPKIVQTVKKDLSTEIKPNIESDIVSLGIVFFEMYTFCSYNPTKDVSETLKDVTPFNRRLSKMIQRMIEKENNLTLDEIIRKLRLIRDNPNNEEEQDKIHKFKRKSKEFFSGITKIFSPRSEDEKKKEGDKRRKSIDFGNIFNSNK